jgi:hypothetical protein
MKYRAVFLVAIGVLFGRMGFGATQLITNGGFEAVSVAPWQFSQNLASVPVVANPAVAHSGNNYLSLGNVNGVANQAVFQVFDVPTNALVARFSYFWGCSIGLDRAGVDVMSSFVQRTGENATFLNPHGSANSGYQEESFDLTAYAGKTVGFGFVLQASSAGEGVRTFFALDDVRLTVFTPADIPANDDFANATLLTTTTNISVVVTNVVATKEAGESKHAGANGGHSVWWKWTAPSNGVVIINTANSSFNTVLGVYTGTSVSNLTQVAANDDQDSAHGVFTSQVKFLVDVGTEYEIAVDGKNAASGLVQLNLSFSPDSKDPTVTISSPKSGAKLTNSTVIVQGTASDNLDVSLVQFRLENAAGTNDFQDADGTNDWTATVTDLVPGPNTIRVRAFDTSNNESPNVASTVTFVVVSPITVDVTGTGTVSPDLDQMLLQVGNTFTITAKPGTGQVFSSWTGSITSTAPALTFVMQSNMVLHANFVPNPFTPVAGVYQGLFYDTNNPAHQSSGFFNGTVTTAGSLSAKVIVGGKSYSLSGLFSGSGSFSNNIVRKGLTSVSVQLNLDLGGGGIAGVLSDGTWTSEIGASRTTASAGATAGKYTLLIPGEADSVGHPGGDSYGTIVVSTTGAIALKGVLADSSKAAQKANLLVTGQWPFYVPLYAGKGSILGWLTFSNGVISGTVDWFKPTGAVGKLYPAGFTNVTEAAGSSYVFTSGVPVLDFSTGQLWLANGNLAGSFTNQIALDSASKVTSTNATLKLTITTSTGLFKGTIANPATGSSIKINGVVLQRQNFGGGFFTGTSQAGRVFFGP